MIYTTPISQYNMQNIQQLGQMMQDQEAYTPSINLLSSGITAPAGYSLYQWQQELSLAREQYFVRPFVAAGQLAATSLGTALTFSPLLGQMLPEAAGATLNEAGKWVGGSKWATRIGNAAMGIDRAAHAFSTGVGGMVGQGIGWGTGQLGRGSTTNYILGGAFTSANKFLGETFGTSTGKLFNSKLSGYIDEGASYLNGTINYIGSSFDPKIAKEIDSAKQSIKATKQAMAGLAKESAEYKALVSKISGYKKTLKNLKRASAFKAAGDLATTFKTVGGAAGSLIGAFLNPVYLLKQAVIDRAIDYGMESYENYSTRMEMNRELLAKGGRILRFGDSSPETGIDGGFSVAQREHLVDFVDRMAARDYTVRRDDWFGLGSMSVFGGHKRYSENLKELKALLSVSADMGMLDMSKSLDEVEKRFDTIVKAVKKMSRITGKSKGELAMALASTQQSEARFNLNDAASSLQRKIYAATATGASLQTILQESAMGAQMGVQAGIGKAAGADFMVSARNIYGRMYRRGLLDRGDIDMMGGEQGVVSGLAAGMMSMTNNNVFKSQMAMFFDMNTGKINRSRMRAYINGDKKTMMDEATERNIAMNTMSYNPFTGREEIGGRLNARMAFVDRALQHGDIKMTELVGMARQMMKENEAVWGKPAAHNMMMGYFAQTMGLDKAALIMKVMNDDSLMKADIKEQLAVSRKQLEDRFSAEYERAASGFGSEFIRGLVNLGGMSYDILATALTSGYYTSNFRKQWNSAYLGWGSNAMSRKMRSIDLLGTDWLPWVGESGLEVYNRYNVLKTDIINNDKNKSFDNIVFNEKYDNGAIFDKNWFKELLSDEKYRTLSEEQKYSFVRDRTDDTLGSFLAGETDEFNFENYLGSDWLSEKISKGMLGTNGTLSYHDKTTLRRHVEFARERILADNPFLSEDEVLEQISTRFKKASYIAARDENWLRDIKHLTDRTKTAEYLGATIRYSGNVLRSRTYAASGYEAQLNLQDSIRNYMSKVRQQGLESGSKEDRQVYARFFMTEEDYRNYLAKKIYNKKADELTDDEKSVVYERAAVVRLKGADIFRKRSEFTQAVPNAPDRALETSEYIKVGENLVKWLEEEEKAVTETELNKLALWIRFNKKDNRSRRDIFNDLKDTTKGKYMLSDRNSLFGEMYSSESNLKDNINEEEDKVTNDDSITGDSTLNREILKTLKALNSTLSDMNTYRGKINPVTTW